MIINWAQGMPAYQSTTPYPGNLTSPENAVDGNTDGIYHHGSCSHTALADRAPWWIVNLQLDIVVERITIYNRVDCCGM